MISFTFLFACFTRVNLSLCVRVCVRLGGGEGRGRVEGRVGVNLPRQDVDLLPHESD